jgi:hypothetical protein
VDFFYYVACGFENLDRHGLLADDALQLAHLLLELTDAADRHDLFAGLHRSHAPALGQLHPASDQHRLDVELTRHLGQRHLAR